MTAAQSIKKLLALKYGHKNVSVFHGRGTARGWLNVSVTIDKAPDCTAEYAHSYHCSECRELIKKNLETVRKLTYNGFEIVGEKPMTYLSDDGYGTESDCLHVEVWVGK